MCVEIQFCTHHRLWDVIFSLNKSKSLSTTGQALWHLYILSPVIFPLTHMYSVEPSSRRLNCTEVETGQRRKAPSPRCIIPFNSFIHGISSLPRALFLLSHWNVPEFTIFARSWVKNIVFVDRELWRKNLYLNYFFILRYYRANVRKVCFDKKLN